MTAAHLYILIENKFSYLVIKLKPVEGLSLKFKPEGLTLDASWSYGGTDFPSHPKLPCDFYEINEILESGKKRLVILFL